MTRSNTPALLGGAHPPAEQLLTARWVRKRVRRALRALRGCTATIRETWGGSAWPLWANSLFPYAPHHLVPKSRQPSVEILPPWRKGMRCRPAITPSGMPRHRDNPWVASSEPYTQAPRSLGACWLHWPRRLLWAQATSANARDPRPLAHAGVFQLPSERQLLWHQALGGLQYLQALSPPWRWPAPPALTGPGAPGSQSASGNAGSSRCLWSQVPSPAHWWTANQDPGFAACY